MICGMERNPTLNMLGYVGVACANIPDSESQKQERFVLQVTAKIQRDTGSMMNGKLEEEIYNKRKQENMVYLEWYTWFAN